MKLGLGNKQILLIETSVTMIAGSIAVFTTEAYRLFFILSGGSIMALFITLLHMKTSQIKRPLEEPDDTRGKKPPTPPTESPESRYSY